MAPGLLFTLLFITYSSLAQSFIDNYTPQSGSIRIGYNNTDTLSFNPIGYSVFGNSQLKNSKAVLITISDNVINAEESTMKQFKEELTLNNIAYLHISSGTPIDLFFTTSAFASIDSIISLAIENHNLQNKNIFFLGVMPDGHRALKYYEYIYKYNEPLTNQVKGIILCESAIDWVRQWNEAQKQIRDSLTEVGYCEGKMISYLFAKNLNINSSKETHKLIDFSSYSYFETEMKKPSMYKSLSIRAYATANTSYWFAGAGKGIYDCNFPDMQGFINEQRLIGNNNAQLIVFNNRKPKSILNQSSTWDNVDKIELINWILNKLK